MLLFASILTLFGCGKKNCKEGTDVVIYNPSPDYPIAYLLSRTGFTDADSVLLDTLPPNGTVTWHTNDVPFEKTLTTSSTASKYLNF